MLKPQALRLYLCTDRLLSLGRSLQETLEAALAAGVTMVQLREKEASSREFYQLAQLARRITASYGVPLVINDRLDIALAVGAEGLHIGQSDLPLAVARQLVGEKMFIGVSAATLAEARAAAEAGADYLGVGPVFPTGSKADAVAAIGLSALREIRAAVSLPIVAIGGIGAHNAAPVLAAGADGVAVISAILSQPDLAAATRQLKEALK